MYIDLNVVAKVFLFISFLSASSGVFVMALTLHGKRIGKLPEDVDTQKLVLKAMVTWPKVYYLAALGLVMKGTQFLYHRSELSSAREHSESSDAFGVVFERRLRENENLHKIVGNGVEVHRVAGETYITLHESPEFLASVQQEDGSFDAESMERLASLDDWMVMDLIDAHPQYKNIFPKEITNRVNLH
jgi:hypothetical protein